MTADVGVTAVRIERRRERAFFRVPELGERTLTWAHSLIPSYLALGHRRVERSYRVIELNNGLLSVVVSPDLGARVLRATDLTGARPREMFAVYTNPANPVSFAANIGGIKASFPYPENSTGLIDLTGELSFKAGSFVENLADGGARVVMNLSFDHHQSAEDMGFLGRFSDRRLTVIVTLQRGESLFKLTMISYNDNPMPRPGQIWNDALYPAMDHAAGDSWIFPTKYAVQHRAQEIWDIEAEGLQTNETGSYFALYPQYGFAGAYYAAADTNHLRVTDPVACPGSKIYHPPPPELWGSNCALFEAPGDPVQAFETTRIEHQYFLASGIGKAVFANEHIAIGESRAGEARITAPKPQVVSLFDTGRRSEPLAAHVQIGPARSLAVRLSNGLRIVRADGVEICDVRLPLVFRNNRDDYSELKRAADAVIVERLDGSIGRYYELQEVAARGTQLSSLAVLEGARRAKRSDDPEDLLAMARTAYRHGAFAVAEKLLELAGHSEPEQQKFVRALIDLECGGSADFSDTATPGLYFEALCHAVHDSEAAVRKLEELISRRPGVIRPRLLHSYLSGSVGQALDAAKLDPGLAETWAVLQHLGLADAAERLQGLTAACPTAARRVQKLLQEFHNGSWQHSRRFEYDSAWLDGIELPPFPEALRQDE